MEKKQCFIPSPNSILGVFDPLPNMSISTAVMCLFFFALAGVVGENVVGGGLSGVKLPWATSELIHKEIQKLILWNNLNVFMGNLSW